jgi:L-lactate dehydrogenase complex protein LldG
LASREAFLARVRQAAEQGRAYRVHVKRVPDDVAYLGVPEALVDRFAAEVNAVGGQAFVVADLEAAGRQLHSLLAEAGATTAVCWKHELLDRLGLAELLAGPGVKLYDYDRLAALPADERRKTLLHCDIGITSCDAAIAETGTLMVCSRPGQERVASLLPPYHVAIVERRQIVPDLIDAFAMLQQEQMTDVQVPMTNEIRNPQSAIRNLPSNVTLITGPSKTGDIELQLTTGVHGPGKWRVIVIG